MLFSWGGLSDLKSVKILGLESDSTINKNIDLYFFDDCPRTDNFQLSVSKEKSHL